MTTIDELAARDAVRDTLLRYTHGLDQRDWVLFAEAFTPDAVVRIPGFAEGELPARDFPSVLAGSFDDVRLSGQHHLGPTLLDLRPDRTARAVTSFLAVNSEVEGATGGRLQVQRAAGVYVDELVLLDGRWLIAERDLLQTTDDRVIHEANTADRAATTGAASHPIAETFRRGTGQTFEETLVTDADRLQQLLDRAAIQDTLAAYAQAQDQNAWDLWDRVFTPDAVIELPGTGIGPLSATDLRDFLREGFNATRVSGQHLVGNVLVDVAGTEARSVAEVLHVTLQTTDVDGRLSRTQGSGLYIDTWQRTDDGWRIAHRIATQKHLQRDEVDYAPDLLATVSAHGTLADVPSGLA